MSLFKSIKETASNAFKFVTGFVNVTQRFDYDCGPAALSMFLEFYDIKKTRSELVNRLNTNRKRTDWESIEEYVMKMEKFELRQQMLNLDEARKYIDQEFPLFICWNEDESHYSVLLLLDKSRVVILDPWTAETINELEYEKFIKYWYREKYWFAVLVPYNNNMLNKEKRRKLLKTAKP